jgi:dolichyl-diphosphooligosaccharide--protein glycosyltransferase
MDHGKRSEKAELLVLVVLGLLLKLLAGRASLTENGILLPGYDEYYHMRRILYTTNNFPHTLWFDSYLDYPHGWENLWPPLFDQICAAVCLAFGQHTKAGVEMVSSFIPMVIGAVAIIVVYYLVKQLFDRNVALLAAFMTILAPNYLNYTSFAAMDHHCLEVLLLLITLLFFILAFCRYQMRYIFASLAGVFMAALAYTWHGAVIYLAAFPLFAAIEMAVSLKEGRSYREAASLILMAFAVALILVLPSWSAAWLWPSFVGMLAIFFSIGIMLAIAHIMEKRKLHWKAFPLSILILAFVFVLVIQLFQGSLGLGTEILSGLDLIWGGGMIGKIAEAEPLIYDAVTFMQVAFSRLGVNLLYTLAGFAALLIFIKRGEGCRRQGQLLLLVLSALALIITFGQLRFLYLSTIFMGILISILFFFSLNLINEKLRGKNQRTTLMAILALFLILTLPTIAEVIFSLEESPPAIKGDWQESIAWLKDNSNTTSFFDAPEKVPEYSIMNWWDYGNWILYMAERPVVANNFQAGLEDAAKFYLSESEENATALLDTRGSRYIFADHSLMYDKLASLTTWANEDLLSYLSATDYGSQITVLPKERLFNTTLGKLYFFDGAGTGHFRLIYESKTYLGESPPKSAVKIFEYVPGALIRVRSGPDQKVGAVLNMTSNQGRPFIYVNEAMAKGGSFEMRVPYSTESRYECRAVNPYLIFSGNKQGVQMQNLNVSEEDVLDGRTIEVAF